MNAVTIAGALMQSSLNALNQKVNSNQVACNSMDGTYAYAYFLGSGDSYAGAGGP